MTDKVEIMDFSGNRKTVWFDTDDVSKMEIQLAYGDEILIMTHNDGRVEEFDALEQGHRLNDDREGKPYTIYERGKPWPLYNNPAWTSKRDSESRVNIKPRKECIFVGGKYNKKIFSLKKVETELCNGRHTESYAEARKLGHCVPREELDNAPMVDNYIGPMWDGGRLRYETYEVYDMLSR